MQHTHFFRLLFTSADVSASSGAWQAGEGRKAPLVASDSSSSGGSDSEEDDKNAGAPPAATNAPKVPGNKTADLKRFESLWKPCCQKLSVLFPGWPVHSAAVHKRLVRVCIDIYIWNIITTLR